MGHRGNAMPLARFMALSSRIDMSRLTPPRRARLIHGPPEALMDVLAEASALLASQTTTTARTTRVALALNLGLGVG